MKWVGLWLQGIAGLGVVLLIVALAPISLPICIGLAMQDLGRVLGKEVSDD